jgi:hypothetical protein
MGGDPEPRNHHLETIDPLVAAGQRVCRRRNGTPLVTAPVRRILLEKGRTTPIDEQQ